MNCDSVFPQIFNINKQHCWIQTNDRAHSVNFRYSITVIKKIGERGKKHLKKQVFSGWLFVYHPRPTENFWSPVEKYIDGQWWKSVFDSFNSIQWFIRYTFDTPPTLNSIIGIYPGFDFGWEPDMMRTDPSTSSQLDGYLYIANAHPATACFRPLT